MVQFLSIIFFLDFFNFCWVFQKFPFFCVTLCVCVCVCMYKHFGTVNMKNIYTSFASPSTMSFHEHNRRSPDRPLLQTGFLLLDGNSHLNSEVSNGKPITSRRVSYRATLEPLCFSAVRMLCYDISSVK